MSEAINHNRRRFLANAAMSIAAARLGSTSSAQAQSNATTAPVPASAEPRPNPSFPALKQIDAGVLNVGYVEAGVANGTAVVLLHGWPYDIHSYSDVAPVLASRGYRVIIPYLRGYGSTRFLSDKTIRNAQQTAVATDVIAMLDALEIDRAIVGGFD